MSDVLEMLKGQLNPEDYRKLVEVRQSLEKRFMKLESETNTIRIMPPLQEGKLWFREIHNHFRVGGPDKRGVCVCTTTERANEPCFIEDVMAFFRLSPNPTDQEYAKALRASRVYWVNAYNVKADDPMVRIVPLSYTTFQQLFQFFMSGELAFLDPGPQGVNVIISKQTGNKYFVRLDKDRSGILYPELMDQRHDFEALVAEQVKTYEEQMAMFPPELVAKMKMGGFLRKGAETVAASSMPPAEASNMTPSQSPEEVRAQMDAILQAAKAGKQDLKDL